MNKYDIGARIEAIRENEQRLLRDVISIKQGLKDYGLPDDHEAMLAADEKIAYHKDRLAAIEDGSLFHQQPHLISIGGF